MQHPELLPMAFALPAHLTAQGDWMFRTGLGGIDRTETLKSGQRLIMPLLRLPNMDSWADVARM